MFCVISCSKEPDVSFDIEVLNCNTPYQVRFVNTSNNFTSSSWLINGVTTTEESPLVLMDGGELQYVELRLENKRKVKAVGKSFFPEDYYESPVPEFIVSYPDCVNHNIVHFENTSTGDIASYLWNFGDGETSEAKSPDHVYNIDGTYVVRLSIVKCLDTIITEKSINVSENNVNPIANFSIANENYNLGNNEVLVGSYVHFVNTSDHSSGQVWSFHDGQTSSAEDGYKTFNYPGEYPVKLVVNCNGKEDSVTQIIRVRYPNGMLVKEIEVSAYNWESVDEGRPDIFVRLFDGTSSVFTSSIDYSVSENETPSWDLNESISSMYDWSRVEVLERVDGEHVVLSWIDFSPSNYFQNGNYPSTIVASSNGYSARMEIEWE
jgi:PKD repeat protein